MNAPQAPLRTERALAPVQVLLCRGCCCGKTERGYPEVPVDRIKAAWKSEKLNRSVQLTISGCLGPCDVPNVAVVVSPAGTTWYGLLAGDADYEAMIEWARERKDGRDDSAAPALWGDRSFPRFEETP